MECVWDRVGIQVRHPDKQLIYHLLLWMKNHRHLFSFPYPSPWPALLCSTENSHWHVIVFPPPPSQTGGRPHRDCPLKQIPERLTRDPPHIVVVVRRMDTERRRWGRSDHPLPTQQGLNNKSEDRHAYYVSLLVGSKTTDHGPRLTLCVDRRPTFLEIRYWNQIL